MEQLDISSRLETLEQLAKKDGAAFETERQELINAFFETVPKDRLRRLQGLQFQIDMERRRAKTPLAACVRISTMMWESLGRLQTSLCDLKHGERPHSLLAERAKKRSADVIDFSTDDMRKDKIAR